MRVIAGEHRSRRLRSVPGVAARPTPDRLRETLFDILASEIGSATFVDAYAGTGAVGIEALSRGAAHCYFLERSRVALATIRENLSVLQLESRATVVAGSVLLTLPQYPADIVFLDPPYRLDQEYELALNLVGAAPPPLVIVQHDARRKLKETYGSLSLQRTIKQGDNVLSFFVPKPV